MTRRLSVPLGLVNKGEQCMGWSLKFRMGPKMAPRCFSLVKEEETACSCRMAEKLFFEFCSKSDSGCLIHKGKPY